MAIKRQKLMADFETTTDPEDCRVWAGCAVDIDKLEVAFLGHDLSEFMEWLSNKNTVCYFHNLKFDGEFILYWLLTHGYRYSEQPKDKTFQTLITDDGLFYSIEVIFHRHKSKKYEKVVFYDSLKKLPFKVATIAKAFELKQSKGSIDYTAHRPVGYRMTEEEKDYIIKDCMIVAEALKIQIEQGLKRMTNASDAMSAYKAMLGAGRFEKIYPVLPIELDSDIRRAYRGGYVYLKPEHKGHRGHQGVTLDVNSLYPSVMYNCLLPYGYPVYFEGEPVPDENYPLFIIHIRCRFELKPGHLPTIQLKNNRRFRETEYLTTSLVKMGDEWDDEPQEMFMTNVDFQLMLDHYVVEDLEFINGFKFKGLTGLFKDYIDHWMRIKETTTGAKRQLAKLMLNSLYGRFAMNPKSRKKVPAMNPEKDVVMYTYTDLEERDPVYTPMGCFITAYAREKTIRSAQAVYDRFIYADTDSLHLIGYDVPESLDVHPTRLGAWKNEGRFDDSKYLRAKTYMETVLETKKDTLKNYVKVMVDPSTAWVRRETDGIHYGKVKVTCAGMPDNVKEQVTYDNFHPGATFHGKLVPRRYPGGIILTPTDFTIQ